MEIPPRIHADLQSAEGMNVPKRTAGSVLTYSMCRQVDFTFTEVDLGRARVNWKFKFSDSCEVTRNRECSLL